MTIVTIEKTYVQKPRRHLAQVRILKDGNPMTICDSSGCEFVSEVEARTLMAAKMAYTVAKSLGAEVREECKEVENSYL